MIETTSSHTRHPRFIALDYRLGMKIPSAVSQILSVAFQPILNLHSGEVHGYEALGRGPAPPAALLDEAARDGWLLTLDWLWRVAAVETIALHDRADPARFYLHMDPRILEDREFAPANTLALLERHALSPERFVLQLSEHGIARATDCMRSLIGRLRVQRFCVALAGVGGGFSSLGTLVDLRPDVLKISMKVVRASFDDRLRFEVMQSMVDLPSA